MRLSQILAPTSALLLASALPLSATALEDWQFDDAADTQLNLVANSAGTAFWANDDDVKTDGSGNLVFTQGTGTDPDNVFRNATLTNKDLSTGTYELSYTISAATIAGGDASGANVGFGIRDESNTDLFVVRLQRQSSALRLEYRTDSTTLLENFGVATVSDLQVRAIVNLDTDTCDVYWKLGTSGEKCMTNLPLEGTGLEADMIRMAANTNITDWGVTDHVDVDFVTFGTYTAAPAAPTLEDWQFTDAEGTRFDTVVNSAGSVNLGAAATNVATNGSGQLVYSVSVDDPETTETDESTGNVFRTTTITDPNRTTGQFELEWLVTSADLTGADVTGANVGFGFRDDNGTPSDTGDDVDLFTVRLQKQNGSLRLQHRVGATNTDLVDFGTTTLADLLIRVVADLDTDTFSVFWQISNGIGNCVGDIPMAAANRELDILRSSANTNATDWDAANTVVIDYLTLRGPSAVATELSLSIASGPGAEEMTLIWPTSTPGTAILESSTNLMDPWTPITDTPTVNGDNNELIISTTGVPKNFFRLRNP